MIRGDAWTLEWATPSPSAFIQLCCLSRRYRAARPLWDLKTSGRSGRELRMMQTSSRIPINAQGRGTVEVDEPRHRGHDLPDSGRVSYLFDFVVAYNLLHRQEPEWTSSRASARTTDSRNHLPAFE